MILRILQFFFGCSYHGTYYVRAAMVMAQCEGRIYHKGPHRANGYILDPDEADR